MGQVQAVEQERNTNDDSDLNQLSVPAVNKSAGRSRYAFRTISVPQSEITERLPYELDPKMQDVLSHSPKGIYNGPTDNFRDAEGHPISSGTVTHETAHGVNGWITRTYGKLWPNPVQYGNDTHNEVEGIYLGQGVGTVIKAPRVGLPDIKKGAVLSGPHSDYYMSRPTPPYTAAYPADELTATVLEMESTFLQLDKWYAENPRIKADVDNLGGRIIDVLNLSMQIQEHPEWFKAKQDQLHTQAVLKHVLERAIPLYEKGFRVLKEDKNWMDVVSGSSKLKTFMSTAYSPQWFAELRKQ